MDIRTYATTLTPEQRKDMAFACGIGIPYFNQIVCGNRLPSAPVARKMHDLSAGKIDLWSLRPDVWPPPRVSE